MKPTEHKTPLEKELIAHIRESLVEHEESYQLGAWEKFNTPKKKQRPLWLPFLQGAAAILVLGLITFLIINKKPTVKENAIVATKKSLPAKEADAVLPEIITRDENAKLPENVVRTRSYDKIDDTQETLIALAVTNQPEPVLNSQTVVDNDVSANYQQKPIGKGIEIAEPKTPSNQPEVAINKVDQKPNIIDFLTNETRNNKAQKTIDKTEKNTDRFTVGVVVAPSFGNVKRLNMGYGLSVDYNLSDKVSLNSGIAYNQMAATKGLQNDMQYASPAASSAIAKSGSTKSLESVEERVTGIDIPLEIKYHVSKNLYANVGVSAFAVINQRRNNTFLEERVVPQSADLSNTTTSFNSVLVTQRVTEAETITPTEDYSYLGFYNLSFGYKKKISKNNSFAIEPFLKLPMRPVRTESLRLVGTGVKLKFDF